MNGIQEGRTTGYKRKNKHSLTHRHRQKDQKFGYMNDGHQPLGFQVAIHLSRHCALRRKRHTYPESAKEESMVGMAERETKQTFGKSNAPFVCDGLGPVRVCT